MPNSIVMVPVPDNDPIRSYAPGTPERSALKEILQELKSQEIEIPLIIDGKENLKQWISTETIGTLLHMRHIITNTMIEFESDDKAKSKSYWSFNGGYKGHEDEGVTDRGEGKYYFKWRKEAGEWKAFEEIAEAVWWTGYNVEG